jgi:hypothetical protein
MKATVTRRSALIGLATLIPLPIGAQTAPGKQRVSPEDVAVLERSAVFDINPQSGALKETIQKGQLLVWRRKDGTGEHRFKISDISVALLRSETGGELKMTFGGKVSSLGYLVDEAKLNVIVRSKGGAALHSWSFGIPVKCADKDQVINPLTHEVPKDFAQNVFANASTVEVAELAEPNVPGTKVQRCSA